MYYFTICYERVIIHMTTHLFGVCDVIPEGILIRIRFINECIMEWSNDWHLSLVNVGCWTFISRPIKTHVILNRFCWNFCSQPTKHFGRKSRKTLTLFYCKILDLFRIFTESDRPLEHGIRSLFSHQYLLITWHFYLWVSKILKQHNVQHPYYWTISHEYQLINYDDLEGAYDDSLFPHNEIVPSRPTSYVGTTLWLRSGFDTTWISVSEKLLQLKLRKTEFHPVRLIQAKWSILYSVSGERWLNVWVDGFGNNMRECLDECCIWVP